MGKMVHFFVWSKLSQSIVCNNLTVYKCNGKLSYYQQVLFLQILYWDHKQLLILKQSCPFSNRTQHCPAGSQKSRWNTDLLHYPSSVVSIDQIL